jgi:hypothetical protein
MKVFAMISAEKNEFFRIEPIKPHIIRNIAKVWRENGGEKTRIFKRGKTPAGSYAILRDTGTGVTTTIRFNGPTTPTT